MTIIEKAAGADGSHRLQSQSHRTHNWMGDGWLEVPARIEPDVWACGGYCNLNVENGVLTGIIPGEKPTPVPSPTEDEDTGAMLVDHEYRLTLLELGVSGEVI